MLLLRVVSSVLPLVGCQGTDAPANQPRPTIEARDERGDVVARVTPGRPCRAVVEGKELLVGGRPLVARYGDDHWTGEDAANGTTLRKNAIVVARLHAKQLFDANGVPVLRVLDNGDIVDQANAVARKAVVAADHVTIESLTVTGTTDVAIAAMLTARETVPEVRAIGACHYLLTEQH